MIFCLRKYTYQLIHRPGKANGNADLMSRLPLPATAHDASPDIRLTDPSDLNVYMIGASGVMPARMDPVLGGELEVYQTIAKALKRGRVRAAHVR